MRGNWDTTEPLVHAPNQQRQQQQQTIVEEQRHPLHSPTTPAWGIADRIVKQEPAEDKNNDSGVSPDHYTSNSSTSPRSRRSSSTANCSLSPGSATSQDSHNMQCATFEYSPQRTFKSCGSPIEFARHHSMVDHRGDQTMDVVSSSLNPSTEDSEVGQEILQCPMCAFATINRLKFTEHLTSHCNTKCESPDFVKAVLGQQTNGHHQDDSNRSSPNQGDRSESEETDEPGLRVPRVNSQGKVKTFRCKQCNFVAITKLEFWEHSRSHIKAEKLLTCPKCPFVTEYKHHLEYHLRNHFGSKPFKCDKCSYSCVNKSMLNSHLKSHSNVYQYRCANCSYATKYCHSLKLHLRKYSHKPAMVLNADGSPNPLPIIDVYGTRRGPKQKPMKGQEETNNQTNSVVVTNNNMQPTLVPSPVLVASAQVSPVSHHLGITPLNGIAGINGINCTTNGLPQTAMVAFPYNPIFPVFPLTNHFPNREEPNSDKPIPMEHTKSSSTMDHAKIVSNELLPEEFPHELAIRYLGVNATNEIPRNGSILAAMMAGGGVAPPPEDSQGHEEIAEAKLTVPLDLRKPEVTGSPRVLQQHRPIASNSPRATGTSRRKGRAIKLERRVLENDTDEESSVKEDSATLDEVPRAILDSSQSEAKEDESKVTEDEEQTALSVTGVSNEFICQYCEIAFGNVVMYTVHMGYHGYNDPYTCNMCGHRCTDKVSFFLHIARSKHS